METVHNVKLTLIAIAILNIGLIQAQYTAIPDPNFEAFLIHIGADDTLDGQVLTDDIDDTEILMINESAPFFPIEDLTGIQDFASLELLIINVTNVVTVDFGDLENLSVLGFELNNDLSSIDISGCTNLDELIVSNSNLNSLDISQNLSLRVLSIGNNTGNLNSLDVSQHTNIIRLAVPNCNFTELDVRNGTNENIEFFTAIGNPDLTCIYVDDADYSNTNWTNIDPTTSFVETEAECEALSTEDFTNIIFSLYPNPVSTAFQISPHQEIKNVEVLNILGQRLRSYNASLHGYSVDGLPSGKYIIIVNTDLGERRLSLLIE